MIDENYKRIEVNLGRPPTEKEIETAERLKTRLTTDDFHILVRNCKVVM